MTVNVFYVYAASIVYLWGATGPIWETSVSQKPNFAHILIT